LINCELGKHPMNDREVEVFVDKQFFAGAEYFVDSTEKQQGLTATAACAPGRASVVDW